MGDKFVITIKCAYCGKENKEVYYAPSCDVETFICEYCKKENQIERRFFAIKVKK